MDGDGCTLLAGDRRELDEIALVTIDGGRRKPQDQRRQRGRLAHSRHRFHEAEAGCAALQALGRWVTTDVLPSTRKPGGYVAGQEGIASGENIPEVFLASARLMARRIFDGGKARHSTLEVENAILGAHSATTVPSYMVSHVSQS
jgi:hypothetical protein